MFRNSSLWLRTVVCLLLPMPSLAQQVEGVVLGFDGKPVAGAVVAALTDNRLTVTKEVLTGPQGRFVIASELPPAALRTQLEGVVITTTIAAGKSDDLAVSFAATPHFTLRGSLCAPDGARLGDVDLLCRDADGRGFVTVTTDQHGEFRVRLNQPVLRVEADPMGWQHTVAGPFERDHELAIDLRTSDEPWFSLQGRVFDRDGPCSDGLLCARLDNGRCIRAATRADGAYTVWSKRPIALLETRRMVKLQRRGPFSTTTTALDLEELEHALVPVVGRFVDKAGKPIGHALVFGVDRPGPPAAEASPDGMTDSEGRFRLMLPRCTPFLFAFHHATDAEGTAAIPRDQAPVVIQSVR